MARKNKQRTESSARHDLVKLCAFIGILISAIIFVVSAILSWVNADLGPIAGILNLVAALALLVAVAFPAWDYVKYKTKGWRIVYWIALIIYIFGCVFGLIKLCR